MHLTVSCKSCGSEFSLDEEPPRQAGGNLRTVKCRNCSAVIALGPSEPATLPSQEAPRRAPAPPRRRVHGAATGTPLPGEIRAGATSTPLSAGATTTPLSPRTRTTLVSRRATPLGLRATATPLPAGEVRSIWDAEQSSSIPPAPQPPSPEPPKARARVPHPPRKKPEPELFEIHEMPVSASDEPTLARGKGQAFRGRPTPGKPSADDFLSHLSAGTQGILAAPTIDVSGLDTPPAPPLEVISEREIECAPAARAARSGTVPLFDMSAVLPGANPARAHAPAAPSESDATPSWRQPATSQGRARERKFVIAPGEAALAPKARRASVGIWIALLAAGAAVAALVVIRGHQPSGPESAAPSSHTDAPVTPANPAPANPAPVNPAPVPEAVAPLSVAAQVAASANPTPTPAARTPNSPNAARTTSTETKSAAELKPVAVTVAEKPPLEAKPPEPKHAPAPAEPDTEFDRAAARAALAAAATQAAACRKDGDPSGTASVTITFAPSGRVTSANLQGPPFAGTATGGCIASAMRHATVPAFSGERVTVTKTIVVQ